MATLLEYKCPCCGGAIEFNSGLQKLKCPYCDTEFDPEALRAQGRKLRVVSMPSWDLFEAQGAEYKESVLPKACRKRVAVEAACTMGWSKYVGDEGMVIGLDHFGESAPYKALADKYGFTPEKVTAAVAEYLG